MISKEPYRGNARNDSGCTLQRYSPEDTNFKGQNLAPADRSKRERSRASKQGSRRGGARGTSKQEARSDALQEKAAALNYTGQQPN